MRKEEFAEIEGHEDYLISTYGRVYSYKTNKFLKACRTPRGYLIVSLFKNGEAKHTTTHRLLMNAFVENPNNYRTVNHKDGNKENNIIDNLEWASLKQNIRHAYDVLGLQAHMKGKFGRLHFRSKPVIQLDLDGNVLGEYESVSLAGQKTNLNCRRISACCNGKRNKYHGYQWRFAPKTNEGNYEKV